MLITARADLPGDNDPALLTGPISIEVSIYVTGEVPGGPGFLTLAPDGTRTAFVQVRAHRLTEGMRMAPRLWRRRIVDAEGQAWVIGASGLRCRAGRDSAAAACELSFVARAVEMCRVLAARLGAACILGARGPAQADSTDPGYISSTTAARGQDPLLPVGEEATPSVALLGDVDTVAHAAGDLDPADLALALGGLPGLQDPIEVPEPETVAELGEDVPELDDGDRLPLGE